MNRIQRSGASELLIVSSIPEWIGLGGIQKSKSGFFFVLFVPFVVIRFWFY